MAHPKRKHSRARTRSRRTHQKPKIAQLTQCKQCRQDKPAHMVCPFCGYYAGREIVTVEQGKRKA